MKRRHKQLSYLNNIRISELEMIVPYLRERSDILDFGAGPGHQAAYLKAHDFNVAAVDVETTNYAADIIFPVTFYDGKILPYKNSQFDAVISSNVLEHILDLQTTLPELSRVLKTDGSMVHVLPTTSWRFWTTIFAFPNAIKEVIYYYLDGTYQHQRGSLPKRWFQHLTLIGRILLSPFRFPRHGETGNAITELFSYRKKAWIDMFARHNLTVKKTADCGLSYTGNMFFGSIISDTNRKTLSRFFGSATRLYVVVPQKP
jgi:SAM-dependent methyltransferase